MKLKKEKRKKMKNLNSALNDAVQKVVRNRKRKIKIKVLLMEFVRSHMHIA